MLPVKYEVFCLFINYMNYMFFVAMSKAGFIYKKGGVIDTNIIIK